jgi:predicted dithiol-disulfide oxidoreductase (DUF899 family)
MRPLMELPNVVSPTEWQAAVEALRSQEKAETRRRDALAAARRRLPMVRIDKDYVLEGRAGAASLLDVFEGRCQLLLYHFMFAPGVHGWPAAGCDGCTMFADQIGHLAHLHARDTSFALVSRAPLASLEAYRERMGWAVPWFSSERSDFNEDFGVTTERGESFALSVFVRDGDDVFRTYVTSGRGVEALGSVWTFLDLTPLGRQEAWEDTPPGRRQGDAYTWWRRHDEYPVEVTR